MARIYIVVSKTGSYEFTGNHVGRNKSVQETLDAIFKNSDNWNENEYRFITDGIQEYGENAVLVEIENGYGGYKPYVIVGDD